jgi:hypothetical protein
MARETRGASRRRCRRAACAGGALGRGRGRVFDDGGVIDADDDGLGGAGTADEGLPTLSKQLFTHVYARDLPSEEQASLQLQAVAMARGPAHSTV